MPRPKSNPSFDPAKLEAEVLKSVVEFFNAPDNPNHDVSYIADELQISDLKARKLLITAGERDNATEKCMTMSRWSAKAMNLDVLP